MKAMSRRIDALEGNDRIAGQKWHRVLCDVGQAHDDAFAQYESEHGPIGPGDGVFLVQFV